MRQTLLVLATVAVVSSDHGVGVCHRDVCLCRPAEHPSWTNVNCTLNESQRTDFMAGSLPEVTTELEIHGGDAIIFGANSLSNLEDPRRIVIDQVKKLYIQKHAAYKMNVLNLLLEISNCKMFEIESKAFANLKGPVTVIISDCSKVTIQREAFSWLQSLTIINVRSLHLEPGAFVIDPGVVNIEGHGPGMSIHITNANIPRIPAQAFGSSAAKIFFKKVTIESVQTGAFSAITYSLISAKDCKFMSIEKEAFSQKSLIHTLEFINCDINQMQQKAILSAINHVLLRNSSFTQIATGSFNITVVDLKIDSCRFNKIYARGFILTSWNRIEMIQNIFEDMAPHAFISTVGAVHSFSFVDNAAYTSNNGSFGFIGQAYSASASVVIYERNYYNQPCSCNIDYWLRGVLGVDSDSINFFTPESFCTVDDIFARCFNVPEQNLEVKKFLAQVCEASEKIVCEPSKIKTTSGNTTEMSNPRFPDTKKKDSYKLSERDKKVIGIIIVTVFGCVLIVMFISLVRWMKRKGYFDQVKNVIITSNTACRSMCGRIFGGNSGIDSARSISQLSVVEYSEHHRLNEPRQQEINQHANPPETYPEDIVPTANKITQTLPEELTKELLESLRQKLEDPENYVEAREMIEHLYELIKVEENSTVVDALNRSQENIYDLPFQNTTRRVGRNRKTMVSVGTKIPSLERLLPLSPYDRDTSLSHDYFEPKDMAVHLYAEIVNDKRNLLGEMPDLVGETRSPRGPYLRAVEKKNLPKVSSTSPQHLAGAAKITPSTSLTKMINRPLPEKPTSIDPGEGTSLRIA